MGQAKGTEGVVKVSQAKQPNPRSRSERTPLNPKTVLHYERLKVDEVSDKR